MLNLSEDCWLEILKHICDPDDIIALKRTSVSLSRLALNFEVIDAKTYQGNLWDLFEFVIESKRLKEVNGMTLGCNRIEIKLLPRKLEYFELDVSVKKYTALGHIASFKFSPTTLTISDHRNTSGILYDIFPFIEKSSKVTEFKYLFGSLRCLQTYIPAMEGYINNITSLTLHIPVTDEILSLFPNVEKLALGQVYKFFSNDVYKLDKIYPKVVELSGGVPSRALVSNNFPNLMLYRESLDIYLLSGLKAIGETFPVTMEIVISDSGYYSSQAEAHEMAENNIMCVLENALFQKRSTIKVEFSHKHNPKYESLVVVIDAKV